MKQKPSINPISLILKNHYEESFEQFGPSSAGVDWGQDKTRLLIRYDNMLDVMEKPQARKKQSLLDVGCGFGGLAAYASQKDIALNYTGIDVATNMIRWAKKNIKKSKFIEDDFLAHDFSGATYDYVICNGILTQKLDCSMLEMDVFAKTLIHKMYNLCNKGTAFNIMTTYVNFFAPNLYYKHPAELLSYCLSEISTKVKIDHAYGLYEFTVYVYR
jgi:SAM-dependent methyltransferase